VAENSEHLDNAKVLKELEEDGTSSKVWSTLERFFEKSAATQQENISNEEDFVIVIDCGKLNYTQGNSIPWRGSRRRKAQ
jgi:hypothetical protein